MDLRILMEEYKKVTESLIEALKNSEDGKEFLDDRERILSQIKDISFEKSELKEVCDDLELLNLEKEVYNALNNEKQKVREEIIALKKQKQANKVYGNSLGNINFFSRKV